MKKSVSVLSITAIVLAACSNGTTLPPPDTTQNIPMVGTVRALTNVTYEITAGTDRTRIPRSGVMANGQPLFLRNTSNSFLGAGYDSANAIVIGGFVDNVGLIGIDGTLQSPPTGNATYDGWFQFSTIDVNVGAPITLNYSLSDQTLTGTGTTLSAITLTVAGTVTGNDISGTVNLDGDEATLVGGFFGTDEVAAGFANASMGGVVYGTQVTN